jgi:hypothetical protein
VACRRPYGFLTSPPYGRSDVDAGGHHMTDVLMTVITLALFALLFGFVVWFDRI